MERRGWSPALPREAFLKWVLDKRATGDGVSSRVCAWQQDWGRRIRARTKELGLNKRRHVAEAQSHFSHRISRQQRHGTRHRACHVAALSTDSIAPFRLDSQIDRVSV